MGKNNKENKEVAWMSDLQIGSVFYNPYIMKGVGKVLSKRNLNAVVINGGLLPRVPGYFGKKNAQYFEMLDDDVGKKYGKDVEEKIRQIHALKEGAQPTGKVGIDSLDELIEVAQPEIAKIDVPADTFFYYTWGEEDYENVSDLIETKIKEIVFLRKEKKKTLEEQLRRAESTIEAKETDIETKRAKLAEMKKDLKEGRASQEAVDKLNAGIKKLTGQLEHLNIAYDSYQKHLAHIESEKQAFSRFKRAFTGSWQLKPSEYSNSQKTGVKNRGLKAYKELIYPMFMGKHLVPISHLEQIISLDDLIVNVSHNRHANISNAILESAVKKRVGQTKTKERRGEKIPALDVESHHGGGLKIYAQKKDNKSDEVIYFMQVPPMQDPEELRDAKNRWVKTWDTKRIDFPFASGLTLTRKRDDGVFEVEFYSAELLKKIASQNKFSLGKEIKIEVISDMHIGSPNEPGYSTNYELIEAIKQYQSSRLPDIVVVGGDAINGQHLDQIIHEYVAKIPSEFEQSKQKIVNSKISAAEKEKLIERLEKEQMEQSPITNISNQKDELKRRLYDPYWKKILEKGGEIIFVSGQHYNKSVKFKEDEATELGNMVDSEYRDRVHVFSGADSGSGTATIKGIDIYAIHSPSKGQDEVSGLMNHMARVNRKADLAVGGDYHHPGAGYADGTAFVAAAGLQPWTKYVDQIGKQGSARGIVNVFLSPQNKGYARFEFVFDEALKKILEKEK